jgi:hypothetical protein
MRRCDACRRPNPRGFNYCGFCAAPLENTAMRAEMSKLAAPPGGWPSLARELIEVRFFVERGDLGEAFEMMQVLRLRYPGHPELTELSDLTPSSSPKKVHTQVNRVVDAVLAGSADWAGKPLRRAAPQWQAPATESTGGATQSHTALRRDEVNEVDEDARTLAPPGGGRVNKRVHDAGDGPRTTRKGHQVAGAFPAVPVIPVINAAFRDAAESEVAETGGRAATGRTGRQAVVAVPARPIAVAPPNVGPAAKRKSAKHRVPAPDDTGVRPKVRTGKSAKVKTKTNPPRRAVTDKQPSPARAVTSGEVEARDDSRRLVAREDKTVVRPASHEPHWGSPRGMTMAVDALQPAAPFPESDVDEELETVPQRADEGRKTGKNPKAKGKAGKRRRGVAAKAPRPAADAGEESEEKREALARRRAAKFGQNILGR